MSIKEYSTAKVYFLQVIESRKTHNRQKRSKNNSNVNMNTTAIENVQGLQAGEDTDADAYDEETVNMYKSWMMLEEE
jgi:hypothetical protein